MLTPKKRPDARTADKTKLLIGIAMIAFICAFVLIASLSSKVDNKQAVIEDLHQEIAAVSEESFERGREEGIAIGKTMQEKLSNKPFKPDLMMSKSQSGLILKLMVYGEARGEKPIDREIIAWSAVNRALDKRNTSIYRNTLAGVIAAKGQYEGVTPYLGVISQIVWGDRLDYIPKSARDNKEDMKAWLAISDMVDDLLDGKLSRKTLANHFYSPSAAASKTFPTFLKHLKPLSPAGRHLMYVDYTVKNGKVIYFTNESPYDPLKHD